MATDQINLPKGFVLDEPQGTQSMNIPPGFVLDGPNQFEGDVQTQFNIAVEAKKARQKRDILRGGPQIDDPVRRRFTTEMSEAQEQLRQLGIDPTQFSIAEGITGRVDSIPVGRTVGGVAGSIAAPLALGQLPPFTVLPEEVVTVPLAIAGAGLGGGIGEAVQVRTEEDRSITRNEFLKAFGTEAGFEAGGRVGGKILKTIANPIIKQSIPEAAELVDDFARFGGTFEPTELDRRLSLRAAKSLTAGGIGVPEVIEDFARKRTPAALAYADSIVDSIAKGAVKNTPEEIGEILAGDITRPGGRILKQLDDLFNPLYQQIDDLTGQATVSTKGLKNLAKKELAVDKRIKHLSPSGRGQLNDILTLSDNVSFSDMRAKRTSLLTETQKMAREVDRSQAIVKQLSKLTQEAIESPSATQGLSDEALNLLKNTNRLYASAQQGLKTTFSEKLAKRLIDNPTSVTRQVFPNKNPKAIRLMRQSLIEPISGKKSKEGEQLWNQLRQAWLADVLEKASPDGVIKPNTVKASFRKMGNESINEMFSPSEVKDINKVANLFEIVGQKSSAGRLASGLRIGQASIGGILMWDGARDGDYLKIGTGGALLAGPLAAAKLATSKAGSRLLTSGVNIPRGSDKIIPIGARMVNILRQIEKDEQKAQRATTKRKRVQRQAERTPSGLELRGFGGRGF